MRVVPCPRCERATDKIDPCRFCGEYEVFDAADVVLGAFFATIFLGPLTALLAHLVGASDAVAWAAASWPCWIAAFRIVRDRARRGRVDQGSFDAQLREERRVIDRCRSIAAGMHESSIIGDGAFSAIAGRTAELALIEMGRREGRLIPFTCRFAQEQLTLILFAAKTYVESQPPFAPPLVQAWPSTALAKLRRQVDTWGYYGSKDWVAFRSTLTEAEQAFRQGPSHIAALEDLLEFATLTLTPSTGSSYDPVSHAYRAIEVLEAWRDLELDRTA